MSSSSRPPLLPWSAKAWSRWAAMPRMSATPIPRTRFLILKAPVSTLYEERFGGDRNMFTVSMYCARMAARGIQIGLAIDCTALDLEDFEPLPASMTAAPAGPQQKQQRFGPTVRYFDNPSLWDEYDVDFRRLVPPSSADRFCSASASSGGGASTPKIIPEFVELCASHWRSRPGSYVALFDSRGGLGASSYLAMAYMCERMRAPVHVAVASVKEVMGPHGCSDVMLLRDLQMRYRGRRELRLDGVPSWWWAVDDEEEEEEEEDAGGDGGKGSTTEKRKKKEDEVVVLPPFDKMPESHVRENAGSSQGSAGNGTGPIASATKRVRTELKDMPGLEPVALGSPQYERALAVLRQLTSRPCDGGLLPTRFESDIRVGQLPSHRRYQVTWRSRGRRGFLLILTEAVYFLESSSSTSDGGDGLGGKIRVPDGGDGLGGKIRVQLVKGGMRFPNPEDPSKMQHRTLLDGDLVLDKEPSSGKKVPRYYAFDILCHMGGVLVQKPFQQRLKYLTDGVLAARKKISYDYGSEAIRIRGKEFFSISKISFVLEDVCRGVLHDAVGVAFVPNDGSYYDLNSGNSDAVLLWDEKGGVAKEELVKYVSNLT